MRCNLTGCTRPAIRSNDSSVCAPHLAAARRKNPNVDGQGPCFQPVPCDCGHGDCCTCGWPVDRHTPVGNLDESGRAKA